MKRVVLFSLVALSLTGCTYFQKDPVITIPYVNAAVAYADLKASSSVLTLKVNEACKAGKMSQEACDEARRIGEKIQELDGKLKAMLVQPETPTDWGRVMTLMEAITKLAVAVVL